MHEVEGEEGRRSFAARAGVSLLNLLAPGVGLIRIGRSRAGVAFLLAIFVLLLFLAAAASVLPTMTPTGFILLLALLVPLALFLLVGPIVLTWRGGATRTPDPLPWWRRWYAIVGVILLYHVALTPIEDLPHRFYKPFYVPAESMAPTFAVGDRLVADMRGGRVPRRGEVILLRMGDSFYVKRIAALGGDRIAFADGVPIVNGSPAARQSIGTMRYDAGFGQVEAELLVERLPGEAGEHRILETGPSPVDDMDEVTVPPGHVFVLGDNRDHSADSRVPREELGVEMLPVADIVGRPLFRTWTQDWRWLGTPVR